MTVLIFYLCISYYFRTHKSNLWCHFRENIFPIMLISILQRICSFILSNWSLWAFLECHAQNPSVSSPKPSLDKSGLVFPAATVHSEVADEGCLGVWKKRRGFMHSHRSSFTFWKLCGLPLFSLSHSSLSPAPWGVLLSPPIFIKVSLQLQLGHLFHLLLLHSPLGANCNFCNGSVGDLVWCRGLWHQAGLNLCLPAAWHN